MYWKRVEKIKLEMEEEKQELVGMNINGVERGAAATKLEVTVEEAIEGYVGSFGFSQLLHVFFVSLAWMFDSQNTLVTIFTDAQPDSCNWRCKTPHHDYSNLCSQDVCVRLAGSWEWVGAHSASTIAEWGLICNRKFLAAVPASLFFIGSLFGCAVYGRLADAHLGRKRTLLLSCILTSITTFITSLSPNLWAYALLRFANGFSRSGIGICCLVLSTEAVGRKWRGQVGQYGFFFFTAGFLSLPLLAYPTRTNWRNLYKIISLLPLLYSLLILPFVSESPRWLLVRGRNEEALDVLKKFARLNGKKIPIHLSLSNPSISKMVGDEERNKSIWNTDWAAKRMVMVMLAGFGVGFVYYGVQLNVENLNFDLYFTVALNAMMEIPAVFIGSVLLSFTNRRLLFSLSAYIAGVSCIICIVFSRAGGRGSGGGNGSWAQLSVEAIGFMAASAAFDVSYIYCVELFPTNVRNFAVSMLRQSLMLGASIAPLLVAMGRLSPSISFGIFGVFSIFSGLLSLWLPETKNAPLYETLEQQEEEEKVSCVLDDDDDSGLELGMHATK